MIVDALNLRLHTVEQRFPTAVVSSLPTSPVVGQQIIYKVATGVYWDLIYTGETTYPWAKIGGPAWRKTELATKETTSATYQTSGAPSLTAPLVMEARFAVGVENAVLVTLGKEARVGLFLDGVEIGVNAYTAVSNSPSGSGINALASGKVAQARYKANGVDKAEFYSLYIEIDPLRVG